jgi:hypothetical protein
MPMPAKHHAGAPNVPGDWDEVSREELYAIAQEVELPGRSKMSREDLVEALTEGGYIE